MDVGGQLSAERGVNISAFDRFANLDDMLHGVSYLMSNRFHSLILNCDLYAEGKECSKLSWHVL